MTASQDTIAILMATYNGARYLNEQLESIATQTYENWILIASDDGSTDDTLKILEAFSQKHPGKVEIIERTDAPHGALENFFSLMKGQVDTYSYYAFSDQDDFWLPDKLELSLEKVKELEAQDPNTPCLVFTDAAVVDARLDVLSSSFFAYTGVDPKRTRLTHLMVQNPISGAGILANNALLQIAVRVNSLDGIQMHDQWVGLVGAAFGNIGAVEEPTYLYRQHAENAMGAIEMSLGGIIEKARRAKGSLSEKRGQIGRFIDVYSDALDSADLRLLSEFAERRGSKIARIQFCLRNDALMNGFLRNIGLALFL